MEIYLGVRQAHFADGFSGREIARQFGISQDGNTPILYKVKIDRASVVRIEAIVLERWLFHFSDEKAFASALIP